MKELGLGFLYKWRRKITYTETLKTVVNREDQNYEENEMATSELEYTNTKAPMVIKQYTLLLKWKLPTNNDNKKVDFAVQRKTKI